jgi:hypothetical protein
VIAFGIVSNKGRFDNKGVAAFGGLLVFQPNALGLILLAEAG